MILYDNPFSPFTRKVRMVLWHKGISFRSIDGLALDQLDGLRRVCRRAEVPVLVDGDLVISESADIVDYLEDIKPEPPVLPAGPPARAAARHWQRRADRDVDAIVHDISLWVWPTHRREDTPPPKLIESGRADLLTILDELEADLSAGPFVCGDLSIADFALQPHFPSLRLLGVELDPARHPRVLGWNRRMRDLAVVRRDLDRVRAAVGEKFDGAASPYESNAVVWRGDRIEWLLAKGFDEWWMAERRSGRAVVASVFR